TESEIAVGELALDARDTWRAVAPQGRDCLMATGVEQLPHPPGEIRLRLLDRPPCRHGPKSIRERPEWRLGGGSPRRSRSKPETQRTLRDLNPVSSGDRSRQGPVTEQMK